MPPPSSAEAILLRWVLLLEKKSAEKRLWRHWYQPARESPRLPLSPQVPHLSNTLQKQERMWWDRIGHAWRTSSIDWLNNKELIAFDDGRCIPLTTWPIHYSRMCLQVRWIFGSKFPAVCETSYTIISLCRHDFTPPSFKCLYIHFFIKIVASKRISRLSASFFEKKNANPLACLRKTRRSFV